MAHNTTNNMPPVQGVHATEFISLLDIDRPDILDILYERNGDQWKGSFMRMLQMFSYEYSASQETVSHFEDDWYTRTVRLGTSGITAAAGAAGVAFTFNVDVLDIFTDALGTKHMFAIPTDILTIPDANLNYKMYVMSTSPTTSPPTITARWLQTAWSAPAGLVAGVELIVDNEAKAEGSGQPLGKINNIIKRDAQLQIFAASFEATGTEMTNRKWIEYTSSGENISRYYVYGKGMMDYTMQKNMDGAFMFGQETTNTGITNVLTGTAGRLVKTTKGLYNIIKDDGGYEVPYTPGAFSMATWYDISQNAEAENGPDTMVLAYGFPLGLDVETTLTNFTKDTVVSFASGEALERVVAIGFKQVTIAERTWMLKKIGGLSNPQLYGAPGFEDYKGLGFVIPIGTRKMYKNREGGGEESRPYISILYKSFGGYSRRSEIFLINGTEASGQRIIKPEDVDTYNERSHAGIRAMCVNRFQLLIPDFA